MQLKFRLLYVLVILVVFGGCDMIKDVATITVPVHLTTNIPVVVTAVGMKSFDLVAMANPVIFSKTQDLVLADNSEIAPYLTRVKELELNSLLVTITGLGAGQTINSISLDVEGAGNIFTHRNINMDNNIFTPVIAREKLDQVGASLTTSRKISLTVSGDASESMAFSVGLNIDSHIIAYVLD